MNKGFSQLLIILFLLVIGIVSVFLVLQPTRLFNWAATSGVVSREEIKIKVLLVIYEPKFSQHGNVTIKDYYHWEDPAGLSEMLRSDLKKSSHELANFEIVEVKRHDKFLPHLPVNGISRYTEQLYIDTYARVREPDFVWPLGPADWAQFLTENDINSKVNSGEIDEVWLWAPPEGGYPEAIMIGPGSYSVINTQPYLGNSSRSFITMVLNYERGITEALESFGHRAESILSRQYGGWRLTPPTIQHDWDAFTALDTEYPGNAGVGNAHNGFNAEVGTDYNRTSLRTVATSWDDWTNFPNLTGSRTNKNCQVWNCQPGVEGIENGRLYLNSWYSLMPHVPGSKQGILNNWWRYILDVEQFKSAGDTQPLPPPPVLQEDLTDTAQPVTCFTSSGSCEARFVDTTISTPFATHSGSMIFHQAGSAGTSRFELNLANPLTFGNDDYFLFSAYAQNNSFSFQNNSPIVRLKSDNQNYWEYVGLRTMTFANFFWRDFIVPLDGTDRTYQRATRIKVGSPTSTINKIEIENTALGSYKIHYDWLGIGKSSHRANLDADNTSPQTAITSPSPAQSLSKTATVSASATDDKGINRVELYLDDKLIDYDSIRPFNFSFDTGKYRYGQHLLKVMAYDLYGNTATSDSLGVVFGNRPPEVDFGVSKNNQSPPMTVVFTNNSSDPEGGALTYLWDFGNGTTSTETSPTYTFVYTPTNPPVTEEEFLVKLTATDNAGNAAEQSTVIRIASEPTGNLFTVSVKAQGKTSGKAPLTVKFRSKVEGNVLRLPVKYHWDFGDGKKSTQQHPTHTFKLGKGKSSQKFRVTLVVSDLANPNNNGKARLSIEVKK